MSPEHYILRQVRCYRIVRFRFKGRKRVIRNNVSLEEAQAHCRKPTTKGKDWFDGYDYMPGCKPKEPGE